MTLPEYERTDHEEEQIQEFLEIFFPPKDEMGGASDEEESLINELIEAIEDEWNGQKFHWSVAMDFMLVAQEVAEHDHEVADFNPGFSDDDLDEYPRKDTKTLTFTIGGESQSMRGKEDALRHFFNDNLARTEYPGSPSHATENWEGYRGFLVTALQLSEAARYRAMNVLIDYGLEKLDTYLYGGREDPRPGLFLEVVQDFPRSNGKTPGLVLQAIGYGYFRAKWPHLDYRASKVKTGSERQRRYGDIDGYDGVDLNVSLEIKDTRITEAEITGMGSFFTLIEKRDVIGILLVKSISSDARETIEGRGVHVITVAELEEEIALWDYEQQNRALKSMLHYVSHVEEAPSEMNELLKFVGAMDEHHDSLYFLDKE